MIQAIETEFMGCRFRSRLEARWAVFFTELEIDFQYEPEGFKVHVLATDETAFYLPDFYLPGTKTWCEVKATPDDFDFGLLASCIDWGGALPHVKNSVGSTSGLLLLGPIPDVSNRLLSPGSPSHPILQHLKGGWASNARFNASGLSPDISRSSVYFDSSWGCQREEDDISGEWVRYVKEHFTGYSFADVPIHPSVRAAYKAARRARFEYGEKG